MTQVPIQLRSRRVVSTSNGECSIAAWVETTGELRRNVDRSSRGYVRATSDSATLELIKREFATREKAIECAFKTSESFRALCRDFRDCARALARCRKSESEEMRLRAAEYSELLMELMGEIEARLHAIASLMDTHPQRDRPGTA